MRYVVGTGAEAAAPAVGVVGGGQLARMMQEPAAALGIQLHALVEALDGAAGQVIPHARLGEADDAPGVLQLTQDVDVITVEHEHVPEQILAQAATRVPVRPGPHALRFAQDKLAMRQRMDELGVPQPRWRNVASTADVARGLEEFGGVGVLKMPRDGYDGKGVMLIRDADDAQAWLTEAPGGLLLEEHIAFQMEVAQLLARRPSGEVRCWPLVQTVQKGGICTEVIAPAPGIGDAVARQAQQVGERIAAELDVTGILAVEMFVARGEDGNLRPYVNELAMRPHNSGHWTIEGAVTSQFEQHLRAVLDLPLGSAQPRAPYAVMVNVLGSALEDPRRAYARVMAEYPQVKIHIYGKAVRPGRKLGHVTVLGESAPEALAMARGAVAMLQGDDGIAPGADTATTGAAVRPERDASQ